jgi:hypothetical protein
MGQHLRDVREPEVVRVARPERVEPRAERRVALDVEDRARHLVHVLDDAVGGQHDEAVLDAFDDRLDQVDAHALDRDGRLAGERLDELPLLEGHPAPRRARAHRQHADRPADRADGDVEPLAARERRRPAARRLVVLEDPRGGRALGLADRLGRRVHGADDQAPGFGQEQRDVRVQHLGDVLDDDARELVQPVGAGDRPREGVERGRAGLAVPRRRRLGADRAMSWLVSTATNRNANSERTSCGLVTVNVKRGSTKQKS